MCAHIAYFEWEKYETTYIVKYLAFIKRNKLTDTLIRNDMGPMSFRMSVSVGCMHIRPKNFFQDECAYKVKVTSLRLA